MRSIGISLHAQITNLVAEFSPDVWINHAYLAVERFGNLAQLPSSCDDAE